MKKLSTIILASICSIVSCSNSKETTTEVIKQQTQNTVEVEQPPIYYCIKEVKKANNRFIGYTFTPIVITASEEQQPLTYYFDVKIFDATLDTETYFCKAQFKGTEEKEKYKPSELKESFAKEY